MRDYSLFVPEYIAVGSALAVIAVELIWPRLRKDVVAYLTAAAAIVWGGISLAYVGRDAKEFAGVLVVDDFTTFFRVLAAGIVFATALFSARYLRGRVRESSEYYGLLLTAGVGMSLMAAARELLTAYISLELLSFSLYILVGYLRRDTRSNEASLKYVLLGGFASAMLLYGISILYGLAGSTYYDDVARALAERSSDTDVATIAAFVLVVAGLGFKVSAVPFHTWAPDAYQGAPVPITAFLSTASKAAGFALILRLFTSAFHTDPEQWRWLLAVVAALTIVFGNLVAIQQTNFRRLIAYSSIGQVGYMLVPVAALGYATGSEAHAATSGLLLHLTGYVISTLGAFAAFQAAYDRTGDDSIRGLRGLAETQPFLALVITISLFSFAGLPIFAGFATKLFMFQSAALPELLWLVGIAVAASFVSLYYYLMVMRQMYLFDPPEGAARFRVAPVLWVLAAVFMLATVFIGAYPQPLYRAADEATEVLFTSVADAQVRGR